MPKILAIIQARMGSSRLPGKMLLPIIDGKGPLPLMLERIAGSRKIHEFVIATSTAAADDQIEELCRELKVKCFRGNEDDVLDRFYGAAQAHGPAEIIVRLTGDCPLHDHRVIDQVIEAFERTPGAAFASNVNPPSFPDGLDVEVFTLAALVQTWREADKPYQRRHVTSYMTENPTLFKLVNVASNHNYSALRWTLDQAADYDFIKAVYQHFYPHRKDFRMQEVIAFLEERPDLVKVNSAFVRDAEYYKEVERETPPPPT